MTAFVYVCTVQNVVRQVCDVVAVVADIRLLDAVVKVELTGVVRVVMGAVAVR